MIRHGIRVNEQGFVTQNHLHEPSGALGSGFLGSDDGILARSAHAAPRERAGRPRKDPPAVWNQPSRMAVCSALTFEAPQARPT